MDDSSASDRRQIKEPVEHRLRDFQGRRERINPETLVGSADEFELGVIRVRLDDLSNDAFWLEFSLILSNLLKEEMTDES